MFVGGCRQSAARLHVTDVCPALLCSLLLTLHGAAAWALCGHDAAPGMCQCDEGGDDAGAEHPRGEQAGDSGSDGPASPQQQEQWHPTRVMGRRERTEVGVRCKQLIDAGRCAWLQAVLVPAMQQQQQPPPPRQPHAAQLLKVQRVAYINSAVTGENTLLLLGSGEA
jgi:hypothetical protein